MNNRVAILIERINPRVDRKILILISGLMWCGVGVMLMILAETWVNHYSGRGKYIYYITGFLIAMPVHYFGFLRLAKKNLSRLIPISGKKCVFSFITWKSYITLAIMIFMGIILRHSSIPKNYLSILYNGIGLGLFLSGIRYLRTVLKLNVDKPVGLDR